jgi:hypothetical protein
MNTSTINAYLARRCKGQFLGVFSSDTLPSVIRKRPALLVCNTDPSDRSGEHWICIYIDENRHGEFFDSFGRSAGMPFNNYMNTHCIHWTYNSTQLQSIISTYCGHYCVFYCLYRSRGIDMNRIVGMFTSDTGVNDYLVQKFVLKIK